MLQKLLDFRKEQDWPLQLSESDIKQECRDSGVHSIEGPDKKGRLIFVLRPKNMRKGVAVKDYQKDGMHHVEKISDISSSPIVILLDLSDIDVTFAYRFLMTDISRGIRMWKGTYPCRVSEIILCNAPTRLYYLITTCKHFLTPKMKKRIRHFSKIQEVSDDLQVFLS